MNISKKRLENLTKRDLDIMNILWDSSKSMTASEIVNASSDLTMNTVQAILRKLLKKQLIEVADIVYSGTVLSRSYRPTITASDFAVSQLTADFKKLNGEVSKTTVVAALLELEPDHQKALKEINQLEAMLEDYKKKL